MNMAEKNKKETNKPQQAQKTEKSERKPQQAQEYLEVLVRIMGNDIPGSKGLYTGLTRIKGVSWAIANAICVGLQMSHSKKIEDLTKDEIRKIEEYIKAMPVPDFMKNRRFDRETGEARHYTSSDLDIKREFDIKRLKEIRSYRGIRHIAKLPVRGQRTRSHFRTRGIAMGVKRKKT